MIKSKGMSISILSFIILLSSVLFAQPTEILDNDGERDSAHFPLSGILSNDTKTAQGMYKDELFTEGDAVSQGKRSPLLAGAMSLLVPGSGQIYNKSYWKAAIFLAIDAAAIWANIYYNKQGDDATEEFKRFANANWSVVRYAEWLNRYAGQLEPEATSDIHIDPDLTKKPWERVNFSELNAVEAKIRTFSHKLPGYDEQQYYELIGKYKQFNHGWAESDPNTAEYLNNIPQQMLNYAAMHIKPDETYYKYASRAMNLLVINHIISAIEAIWSTARYNKTIAVGMEMKETYYAGMYPQLNLKYNF